jgi:pyridoxal phosphate enzyme (YggS family)
MSVADNLARIKETIGHRPIKLVAVTKTAKPSQIEEAFAFGVTEFGENRLQDAVNKQEKLPPDLVSSSNWHFIGHLQTNKVRQAVGRFSLIQSVDSLHLAQEISKVAARQGTDQRILLQVKMADDPAKFGFSPTQLQADFVEILKLPNLKIDGLMTITPLTEDKEVWQQCFIGLKQLREDLEKTHGVSLRELSMGMSSDWQEAITCGATMVRLGRAIFQQ